MAAECISMTKAEAESYISQFANEKDTGSLERIKSMIQSGQIELVDDSDDEPKPKALVRSRKR